MNELRQFPRVHTSLEADLTNGQGDSLTATLSNISPGGVMVRADLAVKQLVCEYQERDPSHQSVEVHLRCKLPGEPQPFLCRCRMIYIRRLSQGEFDLGFRFVDITEIHAGMLHRFIFCTDPKVAPISGLQANGAR